MINETELTRLKAEMNVTRLKAEMDAARAELAKARTGQILTDKDLLSAVITAVMSGKQAERDEAVRKLQRHILRVEEERDQREAECERWATWGTIEVAIRNPNVASYIEHWEKRALSAEAEREACAKVAENPYEFTSDESSRIAAAIRARGEK